MSFDYGVVPVKSLDGLKQSREGIVAARLRSVIHLGVHTAYYKKEAKPPAPYVAMVFELYNQFQDDGVTPITAIVDMAVKVGSPKASMVKVIKALDPAGECKGFDDLIGKMLNLEMEGGKEKDEDGKSKYVNCVGFSAVAEDVKEFMESKYPSLLEKGVGHVRYEDMTEVAIRELHPVLQVSSKMMLSPSYAGSKAEEVILAIRKVDPDFAKAGKKEEAEDEPDADVPKEVPVDMDATAEY